MAGFLGLVALIAIGVGWYYLKRGVNRGVSKVLYKNTNARAMDEVWTELTFTAPGAPEVVQARVVAALALPVEAPPVVGRLYLAGQDTGRIEVRRGSKIGTEWTGRAGFTPAAGGGTSGVWTVTQWTLRDGVVQSNGIIQDMAGVREAIAAAVTAAGGTCSMRVLPAAERVKR
ncbi:MAG: hypothetical protein BGO37_07170 [Cellulomonas sp. 73-92]|uniref:hypothetical protein n=1 Tax=Cellulomonas sp. 73-92 TaxID=1895740 RepID=UPI000925FC98|nr:hypothetical protein [Cellulomonas sp. 73-92]OJV78499.1 MAG: hypothetical protein BGO37_07170 [Cellulomonas sp. 73-92]